MREDSADGQVWQYFPYENARSRAYRWNEDALVSLCDRAQRLCFALAFWNGRDPFLKEGIFGLLNSLIPAKNSLFFEIFSLLICVGNCAKSDCGAAVSCYEIGPGGPEIAKFPVKFPVNREFDSRRVRSALRRQPGSPRFREFPSLVVGRPANGGLL